HEQALLTQVQLRRKILQVRQDRLDQLVRDATVLRLRDVVLGQTKQLREDISGRCGSGAKVAVANRCVDARVGVLLNFLEHRKKTPQQVRRRLVVQVQAHSQCHLLAVQVVKSIKAPARAQAALERGLDDGCPYVVDPVLRVGADSGN